MKNRILVAAVVCLSWAIAGQAAPPPCGGLQFEAGQVKAVQPLPAAPAAKGEAAVCAAAVGAGLKARPGLKSVTVAVRVPVEKRAEGQQIAAAWVKALVAAGLPAARVSSIVPTAAPGTPVQVSIAFQEPSKRAVALIQAMTGTVRTGPSAQALAPATRGTTMAQGEHVATEAASVARLALADGSFVALQPSSAIILGRVELTKELRRAVRIDLVRGRIEAVAEPKGEGSSFDVVTRTAIAGVRGTRFRMGITEQNVAAVETVEGKVELAATVGKKEAVVVPEGKASSVDVKGVPKKPRDLLKAPQITGHLKGDAPPGTRLTWQPVAGALGYRLEIAGDGELATDLRTVDVKEAAWVLGPGDPPGHWFWRVSALDEGEILGLPSLTYSFVVLPGAQPDPADPAQPDPAAAAQPAPATPAQPPPGAPAAAQPPPVKAPPAAPAKAPSPPPAAEARPR